MLSLHTYTYTHTKKINEKTERELAKDELQLNVFERQKFIDGIMELQEKEKEKRKLKQLESENSNINNESNDLKYICLINNEQLQQMDITYQFKHQTNQYIDEIKQIISSFAISQYFFFWFIFLFMCRFIFCAISQYKTQHKNKKNKKLNKDVKTDQKSMSNDVIEAFAEIIKHCKENEKKILENINQCFKNKLNTLKMLKNDWQLFKDTLPVLSKQIHFIFCFVTQIKNKKNSKKKTEINK